METYPYYCVCTSNNSQLSFFLPSSFLDWGNTCNLLLGFFMQNYSVAVSHHHAPASFLMLPFFVKPIFFLVILLCQKKWELFNIIYWWIRSLPDIFWKQVWYYLLCNCNIMLWPMNMIVFWFILTSFHLLKIAAIYLYLFPLPWWNFQGSLDW